ncbi:MAG: hypothetical protein ACFCVA_08565 [Gammaproteobacteria bacterium]
MSTSHRANTSPCGSLVQLLQPTPSAVAKLLAAWDTLQSETQISLLTRLRHVDLPPHCVKQVCLRALDNPNAYVRYLASVGLYSKLENAERGIVKARIETDTDPLVRYSLLETTADHAHHGESLENPDRFLALPQPARLALVRDRVGEGKRIAATVKHALQRGGLSDTELVEILTDYVNSPRFQQSCRPTDPRDPHCGEAEWAISQELRSLWQLVPCLPDSVSRWLLKSLPDRVGASPAVPPEVLDGLTDEQAIEFWERPDIELKAVRKTIALGRAGRDRPVRLSAMRHHFDLTYEEFSALIFDTEAVRRAGVTLTPLDCQDQQKIDTLQELVNGAENLSPVFYDAMRDLLLTTPLSIGGVAQDAAVARQRLHRWLTRHREPLHAHSYRALRLYRLAKQAAPWSQRVTGHPPSGALAFLGDQVKPGATWATFMAFCEAWEGSAEAADLEKYLPRLPEIGEIAVTIDDQPSDTAKLADAIRELESRLNERLNSMQQGSDRTADHQATTRRTELQTLLRALEDETLATRKAFEPIGMQLTRMARFDRVRMALFALVALLTIGFIVVSLA